MQDASLQQLTGSEPLSLAEEYEMQQSWYNDNDSAYAKSLTAELTFIMLARPPNQALSDLSALLAASPMAGDVNVFLNEQYEGDDESAPPVTYGEIEVMVAESRFRRQGFAEEALRLLFYYITSNPTPTLQGARPSASPFPLEPTRLLVRIGSDNSPSLALFQRLGFSHYKDNAVFQETELRVQNPGALQCTRPEAILTWNESV